MQKAIQIRLLIFCFLIGAVTKIKAQKKLFSIATASPIFQPKIFSPVFSEAIIKYNSGFQNKTPLILLKSDLKQAFFCKMEDKLYKRFNVWIKLRAGSDEYYRSLIVLPRETGNKCFD